MLMKKSWKSIGMLKYLSSYLSTKTLDRIYKLIVRSQFDYCDVIYHTPPFTNPFDSSITLHQLMEAIERVQYQAARIITGTWKCTSINKFYEELGWETLLDRRRNRCIIQFLMIHNWLTPRTILYIYHNILCKTSRCKTSRCKASRCKTSRCKTNFFPVAIKFRNNLCIDFH